ncbi:unnamed protein product [Prunus armeniaca]
MQALPNLVVVGKDSESMVTEIGPLLHLQGTFCLSRLENVMDAEDARQANLNVMEGLHALLLESSDTAEKESDVLKMLKPHRNLKELMIKGYGVLVKLENCSNCRFLPTLGQLPSPKMLYLRRMSGVEGVWVSSYWRGKLVFSAIGDPWFEDMQHWKEWYPCEGDQGIRPLLENRFDQ